MLHSRVVKREKINKLLTPNFFREITSSNKNAQFYSSTAQLAYLEKNPSNRVGTDQKSYITKWFSPFILWIIPFRMKPSRKKMRTIHIMMMIVLTLDLLKIQVFLFQVLRWQFSIESDMIFTLRVPTLNWTFVCWREALTHQKTSPPLRRFTERVKMRQEEMWSSVVDFDTNFWSSY